MKKIIVLLMLIISVKGSGQVLQKPAVYGYEFRRLAVDTLFAVPADTFSVPASLQSFPFIARKGTSFYFWNTSTHVWAAFSAAGATPTWQQTLTAGSTLTTNNTILAGSTLLKIRLDEDQDFTGFEGLNYQSLIGFQNGNAYVRMGNPSGINGGLNATTGGATIFGQTAGSVSQITTFADSIKLYPHLGKLFIDTLTNLSTQNTLLGWKQGSGQGQVGYVTLGSGLSLSSGVLNTSGTVPTPISSLTAATGTNSIDNAAFQQQWSWNTLNGAGLYLFSSSTASTGSNHRLLQVSTDGANAAASATTFGALIENDHTGTTSTNIGISASASSGTTNIAGRFEASGGTTSIGGQFSSSGGTTNYGITGSVTGAATTNYGAEFSASGGTTNNALNIAAGALTLNGSAGTSGQVLTSGGANALPTWATPSSGGTPGGSDTYIQFNDGGSFGGDAGFTYNKTTNIFSTNNGAYRPTGTISFSDAGAGSVYKSSSDGLVLRAVTGSGYDFMIYDASGAGIFGNQTGTSQLGSTSQIGAGLLGYGSWNAWMNLRGGTTTNASLTIRDGVAPSSPAEGQIWRTTDKVYNVIQTGAATKEFTLNDIALTSGRIPYTTTNGRLTDTATFVRLPGGNVGIGTSSPAASAVLDVTSTTGGALMPRMTTTERNAISSPAVGLMIYNTTDSAFNYYKLAGWSAIGGAGGWGTTGTVATLTGNSTVATAGHNFNFSNGGVGVGTVSGIFNVSDGTHSFLRIDTLTYGYQFGDLEGHSGNGATGVSIPINGNGVSVTAGNNGYIIIDNSTHSMDLGDIDGWGNLTYIAIEDNDKQIRLNSDSIIKYTATNGHQFIGNIGVNQAASVALEVNGEAIINNGGNQYFNSGAGLGFIGEGQFNVNGTSIQWDDATTQKIIYNADGGHEFAGAITMSVLAGTGSRAVLADASGVLSAPVSDRSTKQNIQPLQSGINTLMKLKPVSFEYKEGFKNYGNGVQVGFVAQDIQKILPNSVFTNNSNGKMGYNEIDLVPILVKSLQEAVERIEALEKEVKKLKRK